MKEGVNVSQFGFRIKGVAHTIISLIQRLQQLNHLGMGGGHGIAVSDKSYYAQ
jgi:hypothetical protein